MKKLLLILTPCILTSLLLVACGGKESTAEEKLASDAEKTAVSMDSDAEKAAIEAEAKAKEMADKAEAEAKKAIEDLKK